MLNPFHPSFNSLLPSQRCLWGLQPNPFATQTSNLSCSHQRTQSWSPRRSSLGFRTTKWPDLTWKLAPPIISAAIRFTADLTLRPLRWLLKQKQKIPNSKTTWKQFWMFILTKIWLDIRSENQNKIPLSRIKILNFRTKILCRFLTRMMSKRWSCQMRYSRMRRGLKRTTRGLRSIWRIMRSKSSS